MQQDTILSRSLLLEIPPDDDPPFPPSNQSLFVPVPNTDYAKDIWRRFEKLQLCDGGASQKFTVVLWRYSAGFFSNMHTSGRMLTGALTMNRTVLWAHQDQSKRIILDTIDDCENAGYGGLLCDLPHFTFVKKTNCQLPTEEELANAPRVRWDVPEARVIVSGETYAFTVSSTSKDFMVKTAPFYPSTSPTAGLIHYRAAALTWLLQPSDSFLAELEEEFRPMGLDSSCAMSVHLRRGDKELVEYGKWVKGFVEPLEFAATAMRMLRNDTDPAPVIFLATDNEDAVEPFKTGLKDSEKHPRVVLRSSLSRAVGKYRKPDYAHSDKNEFSHPHQTLLDFFGLIQCQRSVVTLSSNLGQSVMELMLERIGDDTKIEKYISSMDKPVLEHMAMITMGKVVNW